MWSRVDLKINGKTAFQRNYWTCVGVSVVASLLSGQLFSSANNANRFQDGFRSTAEINGHHFYLNPVVSAVLVSGIVLAGLAGLLFGILVGNVIEIGKSRYYMENREHQTRASQLFFGFRNGRYGNAVLIMFLRNLYIFLWSLLLIVPGIIKQFAYMMVPYILSENPNMDRKRALELSEEMMDGHKMDAFILGLSFLGWVLLSVCTCGILMIFYVSPYIDATHAEFYAAVKADAMQRGITTEYELPGHYYETL